MHERPFTSQVVDGVLVVSGAVVDEGTFALRTALREASADLTHDLVVDLSDVDYLPSVGIGVLAKAMGEARSHGVVLDLVVEPGTAAHRVLSVCGLPFRIAGQDDEGTGPLPA